MRFQKLSDLEQEVRHRREVFENSRAKLFDQLNTTTHSLGFIKRNSKIGLGTAISLLPLLGFLIKKKGLPSVRRAGFLFRIFQFGRWFQIGRAVLPVVAIAITKAGMALITGLLKKRRSQ